MRTIAFYAFLWLCLLAYQAFSAEPEFSLLVDFTPVGPVGLPERSGTDIFIPWRYDAVGSDGEQLWSVVDVVVDTTSDTFFWDLDIANITASNFLTYKNREIVGYDPVGETLRIIAFDAEEGVCYVEPEYVNSDLSGDDCAKIGAYYHGDLVDSEVVAGDCMPDTDTLYFYYADYMAGTVPGAIFDVEVCESASFSPVHEPLDISSVNQFKEDNSAFPIVDTCEVQVAALEVEYGIDLDGWCIDDNPQVADYLQIANEFTHVGTIAADLTSQFETEGSVEGQRQSAPALLGNEGQLEGDGIAAFCAANPTRELCATRDLDQEASLLDNVGSAITAIGTGTDTVEGLVDGLSGFEIGDGPTLLAPLETCPLPTTLDFFGQENTSFTSTLCDITGGPLRWVITLISYIFAAQILYVGASRGLRA